MFVGGFLFMVRLSECYVSKIKWQKMCSRKLWVSGHVTKGCNAVGIRCDLWFELLSETPLTFFCLKGPFKNRADIFPLPSSNCIRVPLQRPLEGPVRTTTSYCQKALNKYPTGHSWIRELLASTSWVCPEMNRIQTKHL